MLVLLWAVCLAKLALAIAAEVQVPVMVTYGGTAGGKANWTARSDIEAFPELNAGDAVQLLGATPRELKLGIWERSPALEPQELQRVHLAQLQGILRQRRSHRREELRAPGRCGQLAPGVHQSIRPQRALEQGTVPAAAFCQ
jgi:hypothetical protein